MWLVLWCILYNASHSMHVKECMTCVYVCTVVCMLGFVHFEYSSKCDWIFFKVHWSYGFGTGHEDGRSGPLSRSVADVVQQQWSPYSGRLRSSRNGGKNFSGRVGSENKKTLPRLDMFKKKTYSFHSLCLFSDCSVSQQNVYWTQQSKICEVLTLLILFGWWIKHILYL